MEKSTPIEQRVWNAPFDTDQVALDTVMEVIEKDGIGSFLESAPRDCALICHITASG